MQAIQVRMSLPFHTELRVKMILIQGSYFNKVCKDIFIGPTVIFTPPDLRCCRWSGWLACGTSHTSGSMCYQEWHIQLRPIGDPPRLFYSHGRAQTHFHSNNHFQQSQGSTIQLGWKSTRCYYAAESTRLQCTQSQGQRPEQYQLGDWSVVHDFLLSSTERKDVLLLGHLW